MYDPIERAIDIMLSMSCPKDVESLIVKAIDLKYFRGKEDDDKEKIVKYRLEGYTVKEICLLTGCKVGQIEKCIRMAKEIESEKNRKV